MPSFLSARNPPIAARGTLFIVWGPPMILPLIPKTAGKCAHSLRSFLSCQNDRIATCGDLCFVGENGSEVSRYFPIVSQWATGPMILRAWALLCITGKHAPQGGSTPHVVHYGRLISHTFITYQPFGPTEIRHLGDALEINKNIVAEPTPIATQSAGLP